MEADNKTFATSIVVGILFLLVSDAIWLLCCVKRLYTSIRVYNDMLCREILDLAITKFDGSLINREMSIEPRKYYDKPTISNPLFRMICYAINCSIPPVLLTYAVDYGAPGASSGALLGFYAFYVFNVTSLCISSYSIRDAFIDMLYGTVSFAMAGTIIEAILTA